MPDKKQLFQELKGYKTESGKTLDLIPKYKTYEDFDKALQDRGYRQKLHGYLSANDLLPDAAVSYVQFEKDIMGGIVSKSPEQPKKEVKQKEFTPKQTDYNKGPLSPVAQSVQQSVGIESKPSVMASKTEDAAESEPVDYGGGPLSPQAQRAQKATEINTEYQAPTLRTHKDVYGLDKKSAEEEYTKLNKELDVLNDPNRFAKNSLTGRNVDLKRKREVEDKLNKVTDYLGNYYNADRYDVVDPDLMTNVEIANGKPGASTYAKVKKEVQDNLNVLEKRTIDLNEKIATGLNLHKDTDILGMYQSLEKSQKSGEISPKNKELKDKLAADKDFQNLYAFAQKQEEQKAYFESNFGTEKIIEDQTKLAQIRKDVQSKAGAYGATEFLKDAGANVGLGLAEFVNSAERTIQELAVEYTGYMVPYGAKAKIHNLLKSQGKDKEASDFISEDYQKEKIQESKRRGEYMKPSDISMSPLEQNVEINGKRYIVEDGKVIGARDKDGFKIPDFTESMIKDAKAFEANPSNYKVSKTSNLGQRVASTLSTGSQIVFDMAPTLIAGAATGGSGLAVGLGSFAQMYAPLYNKGLEEFGDARGAALYATTLAAAMSYIEVSLGKLEQKFGQALAGKLNPEAYVADLDDLAKRVALGQLPASEFNAVAIRSFAKRAVAETPDELKEEILQQLTEDVADISTGIKDNIKVDDYIETAILTPIAVLPVGAITAAINGDPFKSNIRAAINKPNKFNEAVDNAVANGDITQEQAKKTKAFVGDIADKISEYNGLADKKTIEKLKDLHIEVAIEEERLKTAKTDLLRKKTQEKIDKAKSEIESIEVKLSTQEAEPTVAEEPVVSAEQEPVVSAEQEPIVAEPTSPEVAVQAPDITLEPTTEPTVDTANDAVIDTASDATSEGVTDGVNDGVGGDIRSDKDFANENESYRIIVGDEAFNDIVESGVVRTNAKNKGGQSLADKLANRPTLFPSFSKGKAQMDYANSNENHYIIVSQDSSIQPSTKGRHGKGTTMFPTDANGNPMESISGDKVKVYKHLGNGRYELVYANGKAVDKLLASKQKTKPAQKEGGKINEGVTEGATEGANEGVKVDAEIEAKKADIERRRQGELNQKTDAGYSTIALDYLFTGGRDVIQSTDYLLQALVGGFTSAAKEINDIRNKYADKLGNIKDDINSDIYNQMMSEIRDVINKKYNNSKATEIFDKVLKNATGFTSREGNQVSIELDKLNEQNESKVNAKYDAELAALEAKPTKDIEAKKADIERRRQEELKERIVYDRKPSVGDGEFRIVGDPNKQIYRINENTGRLQVKDNETGLWTVEGTHGKIELETAQRSGFEKLKERINAKYDAELEALKDTKTSEESNKPSVEKQTKPLIVKAKSGSEYKRNNNGDWISLKGTKATSPKLIKELDAQESLNKQNDKENKKGLPSQEQGGQPTVEAKSDKEASGEKAETSGVLQAQEEVTKEVQTLANKKLKVGDVKKGDIVIWNGQEHTVTKVHSDKSFDLSNNAKKNSYVKEAVPTDEEFGGRVVETNTTKKQENGKVKNELPNTLSQAEKQGSIRGGENNARATTITAEVHRASEGDKAKGVVVFRRLIKEREQASLEKFAVENKLILTQPVGEDIGGAEQSVYVSDNGSVVEKVNENIDPDTTWNDLFHRIAIHNALFPDVSYTLKGFTYKDGLFAAVFEQPFIKSGGDVKFSNVKSEMEKIGFKQLHPKSKDPEKLFTFVNDKIGIIVKDLHGENVIKGVDGILHFIDPIIEFTEDRKLNPSKYENLQEVAESDQKEEEKPTSKNEFDDIPFDEFDDIPFGEGDETKFSKEGESKETTYKDSSFEVKSTYSPELSKLIQEAEKAGNRVKVVALRFVKAIIPTLRNAGIKLKIHPSNESMLAAQRNVKDFGSPTKGFYDPKTKELHLNFDKITADTPIHEMLHPIIGIIFKAKPDVIKKWVDNVKTDPVIGKDLDDFVERYYGNDPPAIKQEELIVTYLGLRIAEILKSNPNIMSDTTVSGDKGLKSLYKKLIQSVKDLLNNLGVGIYKKDIIGSIGEETNITDLALTIADVIGKNGIIELGTSRNNGNLRFSKGDNKDTDLNNIYKKIEQDAKGIQQGTLIYERFSREEQEGIRRGGKILSEAALLTGASGRTNQTNDQKNRRQEKSIEAYAKGKGIWIDKTNQNFNEKYKRRVGAGKEAIVWYKGNEKVIKTQNTYQYRTLQEKLDSIILHNTQFPESALKVVGFGKNSQGDFQVIVEQQFFRAAKPLTQEQVDIYADSMGYKPTKNEEVLHNFQNDKTLLRDFHEENVLRTKEGNLVVIDSIMRLNTPDLGYGGTREVGEGVAPINDVDSSPRFSKESGALELYTNKVTQRALELHPEAKGDKKATQKIINSVYQSLENKGKTLTQDEKDYIAAKLNESFDIERNWLKNAKKTAEDIFNQQTAKDVSDSLGIPYANDYERNTWEGHIQNTIDAGLRNEGANIARRVNNNKTGVTLNEYFSMVIHWADITKAINKIYESTKNGLNTKEDFNQLLILEEGLEYVQEALVTSRSFAGAILGSGSHFLPLPAPRTAKQITEIYTKLAKAPMSAEIKTSLARMAEKLEKLEKEQRDLLQEKQNEIDEQNKKIGELAARIAAKDIKDKKVTVTKVKTKKDLFAYGKELSESGILKSKDTDDTEDKAAKEKNKENGRKAWLLAAVKVSLENGVDPKNIDKIVESVNELITEMNKENGSNTKKTTKEEIILSLNNKSKKSVDRTINAVDNKFSALKRQAAKIASLQKGLENIVAQKGNVNLLSLNNLIEKIRFESTDVYTNGNALAELFDSLNRIEKELRDYADSGDKDSVQKAISLTRDLLSNKPQSKKTEELKKEEEKIKTYKQKVDDYTKSHKGSNKSYVEGLIEILDENGISPIKRPTVYEEKVLAKAASIRKQKANLVRLAKEANRVANASMMEKAKELVKDIFVNLFRSLKVTSDLSAPLTNALFAEIDLIKDAAIGMDSEKLKVIQDAWGKAIKAAKAGLKNDGQIAQDYYEALQQLGGDIFEHLYGLKLTHPFDPELSEEYFKSNLAVKLGTALGNKFKANVVQASEAHMVTYLNQLRYHLFKAYYDANPSASKEELKNHAELINNLSGTSKDNVAEMLGDSANYLFLAFKYMYSRWKMLGSLASSDDNRRAVAWQVMTTIGIVVATIALLGGDFIDIDDEPTSNSFLKLRIGDQYVESIPGLSNIVRMFAHTAAVSANAYGMEMSNIRQSNAYFLGDRGNNISEPLLKYLGGRLNPSFSTIKTLATGKDFMGRPYAPGLRGFLAAVGEQLSPITIGSVAETLSGAFEQMSEETDQKLGGQVGMKNIPQHFFELIGGNVINYQNASKDNRVVNVLEKLDYVLGSKVRVPSRSWVKGSKFFSNEYKDALKHRLGLHILYNIEKGNKITHKTIDSAIEKLKNGNNIEGVMGVKSIEAALKEKWARIYGKEELDAIIKEYKGEDTRAKENKEAAKELIYED